MAKAQHIKGTSHFIKNAWRQSGRGLSLKEFALSLASPESYAWFDNKKANPKAPLKKIGKTRKRVKSGGKVQQAAKKA